MRQFSINGLRTLRTGLIFLLISLIWQPFYSLVLSVINLAIQTRGVALTVLSAFTTISSVFAALLAIAGYIICIAGLSKVSMSSGHYKTAKIMAIILLVIKSVSFFTDLFGIRIILNIFGSQGVNPYYTVRQFLSLIPLSLTLVFYLALLSGYAHSVSSVGGDAAIFSKIRKVRVSVILVFAIYVFIFFDKFILSAVLRIQVPNFALLIMGAGNTFSKILGVLFFLLETGIAVWRIFAHAGVMNLAGRTYSRMRQY